MTWACIAKKKQENSKFPRYIYRTSCKPLVLAASQEEKDQLDVGMCTQHSEPENKKEQLVNKFPN
jgi:hypothetical protein